MPGKRKPLIDCTPEEIARRRLLGRQRTAKWRGTAASEPRLPTREPPTSPAPPKPSEAELLQAAKAERLAAWAADLQRQEEAAQEEAARLAFREAECARREAAAAAEAARQRRCNLDEFEICMEMDKESGEKRAVELGRGGFGVVSPARWSGGRGMVAIKRLIDSEEKRTARRLALFGWPAGAHEGAALRRVWPLASVRAAHCRPIPIAPLSHVFRLFDVTRKRATRVTRLVWVLLLGISGHLECLGAS